MAHEHIVIRGAREHNLKDVTVSLPRERLVVITGLSGSGKSSLAFDTLYAEGQRRYVESLSAYARQFLGQMDKPDVDSIEGLSPAISIDQKTTARNPRSTVGTVTETYDYLRLLYARVGHPHCPKCGREITGQSAEQIVDQVLLLPEGTRFTIDAPVVRTRKGEYRDLFEQLRADGYTRVKVDGEQLLLEEPIDLDKQVRHSISVVVDRLVMKQGLRTRLTDSVETALRLAEGLVEVAVVDGTTMTYSEQFACPEDGISLPELAPRIFSFNSPHGACPRCTGLGTQREIDPELVVPDPTLSISEGALVPWTVINSNFYTQVINAIADRYEVDLDTPWADLPEEHRDLFLKGTGRRQAVRHLPQPDEPQAQLHAGVRGHRSQPRAALPRDRLGVSEGAHRGVHGTQAVPALPWRPAQGDEPCGHRRRAQHRCGHAHVGHRGDRVRGRARAHRDRAHHRRPHPQGDPRAAEVPRRRRGGLPDPRPRGRDPVGRRGAADPARDPDRVDASWACSTSSTSRRSACTSATTHGCSTRSSGCATSATP